MGRRKLHLSTCLKPHSMIPKPYLYAQLPVTTNNLVWIWSGNRRNVTGLWLSSSLYYLFLLHHPAHTSYCWYDSHVQWLKQHLLVNARSFSGFGVYLPLQPTRENHPRKASKFQVLISRSSSGSLYNRKCIVHDGFRKKWCHVLIKRPLAETITFNLQQAGLL